MLIGLFGTGRNGSTLIEGLLDGLEDTYVHPVEEIFLAKFDDLARAGRLTRMTGQNCVTYPLRHIDGELPTDRLAQGYAGSLDALYNDFIRSCPATAAHPKPELRKLLKAARYGVQAFVREYMSGIAAYVRPDLQLKHFLFKSIETPYIREYAERFPDMKFLHIFRHPVPVCSSQKRSLLENKKLPSTYLGHDALVCMIEKRWVPHARFLAEHRDDPRHVVVLYEKLTADPRAELGRVAQALGLRLPPRPNVQTVFCDQERNDWGFNPSKAGVKMPREAVSNLQASLKYEEVLTAREIDYINLKTGALQEQLGYEVSSHPSRAQVLAKYAVLERSEWANVRGVRDVARALYGAVYRRLAIF